MTEAATWKDTFRVEILASAERHVSEGRASHRGLGDGSVTRGERGKFVSSRRGRDCRYPNTRRTTGRIQGLQAGPQGQSTSRAQRQIQGSGKGMKDRAQGSARGSPGDEYTQGPMSESIHYILSGEGGGHSQDGRVQI